MSPMRMLRTAPYGTAWKRVEFPFCVLGPVMVMKGQLALPLRLNEAHSLENFVPGPNAEAVALMAALLAKDPAMGENMVFFWGAEGTGRSHLLQALCHGRARRGDAVMYLPLSESVGLDPEVLEGCGALDVVCLDDVDCVCGDERWERGIFRLFNEMKAANGLLVMTAKSNPRALQCRLPDLASRLSWGLVLHLHSLNDEQRIEALCRRAEGRGMPMDADTAAYLLHRRRRDLAALFDVLERLDVASLQARRKLTKHFVRQVLQSL